MITKKDVEGFIAYWHEYDTCFESRALDVLYGRDPFIDGLIQRAYDNGDNEFTLNLTWPSGLVGSAGKMVSGTSERPILLSVVGEIGSATALKAAYTTFIFTHEAPKIPSQLSVAITGTEAHHCTFYSYSEQLLSLYHVIHTKQCQFYLLNTNGSSKQLFT